MKLILINDNIHIINYEVIECIHSIPTQRKGDNLLVINRFKFYLVICIGLLILIAFSACSNVASDNSSGSGVIEIPQTTTTEVKLNTTISNSPAPTPKISNTATQNITYTKEPTQTVDESIFRIEEYFITTDDDYLLYINKEWGFKLQFPEYWGEHCIIRRQGEYDILRVSFYGASEESRVVDFVGAGLRLFYIVTEEAMKNMFVDDYKKLGTANGNVLYYVTGTDSQTSSLYDEMEWLEEKGENSVEELQEIENIKIDIEVVRKMKGDIEDIISSFQVLD